MAEFFFFFYVECPAHQLSAQEKPGPDLIPGLHHHVICTRKNTWKYSYPLGKKVLGKCPHISVQIKTVDNECVVGAKLEKHSATACEGQIPVLMNLLI